MKNNANWAQKSPCQGPMGQGLMGQAHGPGPLGPMLYGNVKKNIKIWTLVLWFVYEFCDLPSRVHNGPCPIWAHGPILYICI